MILKNKQNQDSKWRSWVSPAIGASAVFFILTLVNSVSFWASIALAVAITILGFLLLRSR